MSQDLLKKLRLVMARRKNKRTVPAGRSRNTSGVCLELCNRSWASTMPKSYQARVTQWSLPTGSQHLALRLSLCPRPHQSRANKLLTAASNPDHQVEGQPTRFYWRLPSPLLRLLGRSSPQQWNRNRSNQVSQRRYTIGACLVACPGF